MSMGINTGGGGGHPKRDALKRVRLERRIAVAIVLLLLGLGGLFLVVRIKAGAPPPAVYGQEAGP
jgi:hypothetical protein